MISGKINSGESVVDPPWQKRLDCTYPGSTKFPSVGEENSQNLDFNYDSRNESKFSSK